MIEHLPLPLAGKIGWPWTEESEILPPFQENRKHWPRISIVTPSFNQGQYLEETIRSVLLQNYPNLEYLVIDGGSTDDSVEILRKYERWITFWISEKDNGQSEAINKGFRRCTGDLVNWICSDDMLYRNALFNMAPYFTTSNRTLFIGKGIRIDQNGNFINEVFPSTIGDFISLVSIGKFWRRNNSIMQQSCFYPLSEIINGNFLNEKNHLTMDYELWGKLIKSGISVMRCDFHIGIFRWYAGQKTSGLNSVTNSLIYTAISLIAGNADISQFLRFKLTLKVLGYYMIYQYYRFRSFLGVKRRIKAFIHGGSDTVHK